MKGWYLQRARNVLNKVRSVLITEHLSEELAWLSKVAVGVGRLKPADHA
jgi:hypothetical protein